jgi:surfeit locus 1 family protein
MRRFPWILTVLTAAAIALLIGLGVWQVQRLRWKEGLITAAEAAATKPPEPLDVVLAGGGVEFRKAMMVCPGLATAPYVELQSIHDGQAGVRLISACRPVGRDDVLLIDRGFVADGEAARPRVLASTLPLVLIGELRLTPAPGALTPPPANNRFYARDGAAMAKALGVEGPVRPETVFALTAINPEVPALRPSAPPAAFSNNHFGYALTWFGLAIALVGFYVAIVRRRLKDGRPSSSPAPRAGR